MAQAIAAALLLLLGLSVTAGGSTNGQKSTGAIAQDDIHSGGTGSGPGPTYP